MWPEFWYDAVLGGKYFHVITEMHKKYGKCSPMASASVKERQRRVI